MALTIKDAFRLAAKDQGFARNLVKNPESLKNFFNLTDDQITHLKKLGTVAANAVEELRKRPKGEYQAITGAFRLAARDREFAKHLVGHLGDFKTQFQLTDQDMAQLKKLGAAAAHAAAM